MGIQKSYPKILNDKKMGEEAKKLFKDANEFLDLAVKENYLIQKQQSASLKRHQ